MLKQLLLKHTAGLNEQTAIDGLVRHLRSVSPMRPLQPTGDLLGRPVQSKFTHHNPAQPRMARQLTTLRAAGALPGLLIGLGSAVAIIAAISLYLPAHRRRRAAQQFGHRTRRSFGRKPTRYRLALDQRQGQPRATTRRRPDPTVRRKLEMNGRGRHCQTNDNQVEFVILAFP